MSGQIPFTKVDDTGSNIPENAKEVTEVPGVSYRFDEEVHVYIVFQPETSLKEGIAAIEQDVLSGGRLDVKREDAAGNAVVAVVTSGQQQEISRLSVVVSAEVKEAAGLHQEAVSGEGLEASFPGKEDMGQEAETAENLTAVSHPELNKSHMSAAWPGRGMIVIFAVFVFLFAAYRKRFGKG